MLLYWNVMIMQMRFLNLRKFFVLLPVGVVFSFCLASILEAGGRVRVRGYYRRNGTYVRPHYRTAPDGNPYNNYSFPGNYNPNTGKISTGNPEIYLRNYYGKTKYKRLFTPSLYKWHSNYNKLEKKSFEFPELEIPLNGRSYNKNNLRHLFGNDSSFIPKKQCDHGLDDLFK